MGFKQYAWGGSCADRRTGLVNVGFVCNNKCLYASGEHVGGERKRKGYRTLGFEQGT
jgi:hypothetical protein